MRLLGQCWPAPLSPSKKFEAVPAITVKQAMAQWFEKWGRPQQMQFDHGPPWYSTQSRMPTFMELWLVGLGIAVVWSRPCRPQDNGKVERSHRTTQSWSAPLYCRNLDHLQESLDQVIQVQWRYYPNRAGQTRLQQYPQLLDCPRPYQASQEEEFWSLGLVHEHLAAQQWKRRVGKNGQISLYNRSYLIDRALAKQTLWIRFDPLTSDWVCSDETGVEVKRCKSLEINAEVIRHFRFHRPSSSRSSRKSH
jgi:hypothetical protein